jgi:hypothetical protein
LPPVITKYAPAGRAEEIASYLTEKERERVDEVYVDPLEKENIVERAHIRHMEEEYVRT